MDEIAKQWLEKLLSGNYEENEYLEFQKWLQADKAHKEAFSRVKRLDALFDSVADRDSIRKLRTQYKQPEVALKEPSVPLFSRLWDILTFKNLYIGMSFCAMLLILNMVWINKPQDILYETEIGEQQVVSLADNTRVTLNTNTQITVNYKKGTRIVTLNRGHAFFEVTSDAHRPFIVKSKQGTVTALGTAFSVKQDESHIVVLLNEGKIKISPLHDINDNNTIELAEVISSTPGEQIVYSSSTGVKHKTIVNLEESMGWTKGAIIFKSARLQNVVKELNRYSKQYIVIADESLNNEEIDAIFYVTDIETFLMALKSTLNLKVIHRQDGRIELSSK